MVFLNWITKQLDIMLKRIQYTLNLSLKMYHKILSLKMYREKLNLLVAKKPTSLLNHHNCEFQPKPQMKIQMRPIWACHILFLVFVARYKQIHLLLKYNKYLDFTWTRWNDRPGGMIKVVPTYISFFDLCYCQSRLWSKMIPCSFEGNLLFPGFPSK